MSADRSVQLIQGTAVSIDGRGVLILGAPNSGKTSLALALIDRGAGLIGDDGVAISDEEGRVMASPPPNITGMIEVRNIGIVQMPCNSAPLCLILELDKEAPRFIDEADSRELAGQSIPMIKFKPGDAVQAIRAEMALAQYGLPKAGK